MSNLHLCAADGTQSSRLEQKSSKENQTDNSSCSPIRIKVRSRSEPAFVRALKRSMASKVSEEQGSWIDTTEPEAFWNVQPLSLESLPLQVSEHTNQQLPKPTTLSFERRAPLKRHVTSALDMLRACHVSHSTTDLIDNVQSIVANSFQAPQLPSTQPTEILDSDYAEFSVDDELDQLIRSGTLDSLLGDGMSMVDEAHVPSLPSRVFYRFVVSAVKDLSVEKHVRVLEDSLSTFGRITGQPVSAIVILRDEWSELQVLVGDILHVIMDEGDMMVGSHSSETDQQWRSTMIVVNRFQHYVVHHPDCLISGTQIVESLLCMRRAVLNEFFRTLVPSTVYMIRGSLIHAVVEKVLLHAQQPADMCILESTLDEVLQQQAGGLYTLDENISIVREQLCREFLPTFHHWLCRMFPTGPDVYCTDARLHPDLRTPIRGARVLQVLETEENFWSPLFGLKGQMDAIVRVRMKERFVQRSKTSLESHVHPSSGDVWNVYEQIIPLELKTGSTAHSSFLQTHKTTSDSSMLPKPPQQMDLKFKQRGRSESAVHSTDHIQLLSNGHRAQLLLYVLMLHERHLVSTSASFQKKWIDTEMPSMPPDHGWLYYVQTGDTYILQMFRSEILPLILQRNRIAQAILTARRTFQFPEPLPTLLDMEDSAQRCSTKPSICSTCPQLTTCQKYFALECAETQGKDEYLSTMGNVPIFSTVSLPSTYISYAKQWIEAITREDEHAIRSRQEIWCLSSVERESQGKCFARMRLAEVYSKGLPTDERQSALYLFIRDSAGSTESMEMPSCLEGHVHINDPIVVSTEDGRYGIASGTIKQLSAHRIVVAMNKPLPNWCDKTLLYRIDRDEYMTVSSTLRAHLIFFLEQKEYGRLRDLIIDGKSPQFDEWTKKDETLKDTTHALLPTSLHQDQRAAMAHVLASHDYSLLVGMPGTGKTHILAILIHQLVCQKKRRVLLVSHTHLAIDHLLLKVANISCTSGQSTCDSMVIVRLGDMEKIHPDVSKFVPPSTDERHVGSWKQPMVVATTCLGLQHSWILRHAWTRSRDTSLNRISENSLPYVHGLFDDCIVDEAGQISEPVALLPLLYSRRFILVGDPEQLSPLVREKDLERGNSPMSFSLFERLLQTHAEAATYLTHQYRMNEDILALCNTLVYNGRLQCNDERIAKAQLSLRFPCKEAHLLGCFWCGTVRESCKNGFHDILRPERQVVFINTDTLVPKSRELHAQLSSVSNTEDRDARGTTMVIRNDLEAHFVLFIIQGLLHGSISPNDVGVLCPYRAQVQLVQRTLCNAGISVTNDFLSLTTMKTEKEQSTHGVNSIEVNTIDRYQGRDKRCLIISWVRSNEKGQVGSLLKDRRRINVALTRAQQKLILIGSVSTLQHSPILEKMIKLHVHRGWLVDADEKLVNEFFP